MKRKLVSIFSADIAEYSRHIHDDEDSAVSRLLALRELMDAAIAEHGGRIANTAGDSVVAEFESATSAVSAAVAIQAAINADNRGIRSGPILEFRIGINIGEVAVQPDGDLLGDGVNVAARLQGLAAPGGICLADNVYQQVRTRLPISFSKLGEHYLKNIDSPISVYAVNANERGRTERVKRSLARHLRSPIMVLAACAASLIALGSIIWRESAGRDREFGPPLISDTFQSKSPDQILKSFDLVAEGSFQRHRYFIIRTWGMRTDEQVKLSSILKGHPVTINSPDENQFLFELSLSKPGFWFDEDGQASGPQIGLIQAEGSREPAGGWQWINGEAVTYTAWKPRGPDNWGGNQSVAQFRTVDGVQPSPNWDDIGGERESFIVEVPLTEQ